MEGDPSCLNSQQACLGISALVCHSAVNFFYKQKQFIITYGGRTWDAAKWQQASQGWE